MYIGLSRVKPSPSRLYLHIYYCFDESTYFIEDSDSSGADQQTAIVSRSIPRRTLIFLKICLNNVMVIIYDDHIYYEYDNFICCLEKYQSNERV